MPMPYLSVPGYLLQLTAFNPLLLHPPRG